MKPPSQKDITTCAQVPFTTGRNVFKGFLKKFSPVVASVTLATAKKCQESAEDANMDILHELEKDGLTPALEQSVATVYDMPRLRAHWLLYSVCAIIEQVGKGEIERFMIGQNRRLGLFASIEYKGYTFNIHHCQGGAMSVDWCGAKFHGDSEAISKGFFNTIK